MATTSTRRSETASIPQTNARAERAELAISAESEKWKDRPHHKARPRVRSVLMLLGILALCALVAVTQIQRRWEGRNRLEVKQAVLTADPIVLEATGNGRVLDVTVAKGDRVAAGQTLALVEYESIPGQADSAKQVEMVAPAEAIITEVLAVAGVAVLGGTDLVSMYEPTKLYFEVPMTYDDIARIDRTSKARFDVPGFGEVEASVSGVEADFGQAGEEGEERLANLVALPTDVGQLTGMAPGIIVDGTVERHADDATEPKVLQSANG